MSELSSIDEYVSIGIDLFGFYSLTDASKDFDEIKPLLIAVANKMLNIECEHGQKFTDEECRIAIINYFKRKYGEE